MEPYLHIGKKAPNFKCTTTFGTLTLDDFKGKWLVFFSHPGSFTPVCTTEFLAFANSYNNFKDLDTELLALSIDSNASHLAWIHNIYTNSNVIVPFPVIADISGEIAKMYNIDAEYVTNEILNINNNGKCFSPICKCQDSE